MSEQFGRVYSLLVDNVFIEHLDIQFHVVRTLDKTPNTIELTIYNLNKSRRNELQSRKEFTVQLECGYEANRGVVFLGDVRESISVYEKPDWVTTVSSGDGEKASRFGRINKSFAAGTDLKTVMKEAAEALPGVGKGNLELLSSVASLPNGSQEFVNGITLSGNASNEFSKLIKSAGYEWSIQNNQLQILKAAVTLSDEAVLITPSTGLVGSPTVSSKGILEFTALLNPKIIPGKQIQVNSKHVQGFFKAKRCEYIGDTSSNDWYVQCEAKELEI